LDLLPGRCGWGKLERHFPSAREVEGFRPGPEGAQERQHEDQGGFHKHLAAQRGGVETKGRG
jgi:hypothetical protein